MGQIGHELIGTPCSARADELARHEFGYGVDCSEGVRVAVVRVRFVVVANILFFRADRRPDFINLHLSDFQVAHRVVLLLSARCADIHLQLQNRVFAFARYVASRIDANTFGKGIQDLFAVLCAEPVRCVLSYRSA